MLSDSLGAAVSFLASLWYKLTKLAACFCSATKKKVNAKVTIGITNAKAELLLIPALLRLSKA